MKVNNPVTGTTTELVFDDEKNVVEGFKEEQVLPDAALQEARELAERISKRPHTQSHMRHVGRIPATIYHRLREQGIAQDKRKLMRWLEENKRFLITTKDRI